MSAALQEGSSTGPGTAMHAEGKRPTRPKKRKRTDAPQNSEPKEEHSLTPWVDGLASREYGTAEQRLHHEILAFVDYVKPSPEETSTRQKVFSCIEKVLKRRFRDGQVRMFGSSSTGLSLPIADIDVVVSTREVSEFSDKKHLLFQLSSMLKAAQLTWDVQVNHRARVPIITFQTTPEYGSFSVDIGINNTDGVQGVEAVNGYLAKMPALKPLVLIVKGFLATRGLNNAAASGLGSYAAICICISFLQLNPGNRPSEFIDKPTESESLGTLLMDFMHYYGVDFPYATSYISVTEGKLLLKESAEWITNKNPEALAVQCLLRPENDVGKAAGKIAQIRKAFEEAYATLLQASLSDPPSLGSLVAFKQSTLDHRERLLTLVNSKRLDAPYMPPSRQPSNYNRSQNTYRPQQQRQQQYQAPPSRAQGPSLLDRMQVPYGSAGRMDQRGGGGSTYRGGYDRFDDNRGGSSSRSNSASNRSNYQRDNHRDSKQDDRPAKHRRG